MGKIEIMFIRFLLTMGACRIRRWSDEKQQCDSGVAAPFLRVLAGTALAVQNKQPMQYSDMGAQHPLSKELNE
ncbi:hypothetical protein [Methermicoccus shengliensis]|uniref:Uncharacterized protein n=1 Tax=Methermicoccus shengliensis TaxID=660064 RepID=A0A832RW02_9EURY|nr:hypothetical protein [Methermicoccus shengliensis]HIH69489.1 hypothetical protein [Methermicoccus shengliensis]